MADRFAIIVFEFENEDGSQDLTFEVLDVRVEIEREVSAMGRRTGASLSVKAHVIIDLLANVRMNDVAVRLFNISIQPDDIVQRFRINWTNPINGNRGLPVARQLSFSGWVCGYELYRPEATGANDFGTGDATPGTKIGLGDQLLHVTFSVVVDDDNIGNLILST